jgi:O-antigen/teichoic acid export membrane protein
VSLNAGTIVLDCALIGLLQGGVQFWRNALFAVAKLVILIAAGFWLVKAGETIYCTLVLGNLISLIPLIGLVVMRGRRSTRAFLPDWQLLRQLGLPALQHHLLNLIVQSSSTALPVLVTILLSALVNAWFYIAWMLSSLVYLASYSLTTVLYAIHSAHVDELKRKIRVTLGLSLLTSMFSSVLILFGATQILTLFGHIYAEQAAWCLRILALGAFPMIIKYHYLTVSRIHHQMARVILPVACGSLLELGIAILGAHLGGLVGLSLGWDAAVCVQAVCMFPVVYRAATGQGAGRQHVRPVLASAQEEYTLPGENERA